MQIITEEIKIINKTVTGILIPFQKAPLVLAKAENGFIMCGYLNIETAEKLGQIAALVTGVKSIDDLLKGKIISMTSSARELGITTEMTGKEALEKMV